MTNRRKTLSEQERRWVYRVFLQELEKSREGATSEKMARSAAKNATVRRTGYSLTTVTKYVAAMEGGQQ